MAQKLKVLIIGGTGYIGKFVVEASALAGHPTFVLVRQSTLSDSAKSSIIDSFRNLGVNFVFVSSLFAISLDFFVRLLRMRNKITEMRNVLRSFWFPEQLI